jgi:acyl-CoA thioesterase-1
MMVALGSVLALVSMGVASLGGPAGTAAPSSAASTAVTSPSPVQPALQVLTIGDSIMRGHGLASTQAWPFLVGEADGWSVTNDGCDGAGVLTPGAIEQCGGTDYAGIIVGAAALQPDIVIIEGSSNDFGQDNSALEAATTSEVRSIRSEFPSAQIVGLSTLWGSTVPPAQLYQIDAQVKQAVEAVGGTYLDIGQPMEGHPELMQAGDVHPNEAGQAVLATTIEAALAPVERAAIASERVAQIRMARISKLVELRVLM